MATFNIKCDTPKGDQMTKPTLELDSYVCYNVSVSSLYSYNAPCKCICNCVGMLLASFVIELIELFRGIIVPYMKILNVSKEPFLMI